MFDELSKLTKDLREASRTLNEKEVRFLVDFYYQMQNNRIRSEGQLRAKVQGLDDKPHELLTWLFENTVKLENQIRNALNVYSKSHPVGEWAMGQKGIGPVSTAGLLAHIDINKAPTVGHIWSFAGIAVEPSKVQWSKGKKRPFNMRLKTLCWKIGQNFIRVSNKEDAFYGKIWRERKELETKRNDDGLFAEQAAAYLAAKNYKKETEAYKAYTKGKLPMAQINQRASRYTVKLFLAHLHEVWYRHEFKKDPPLPYPIAYLGHAHLINAPERLCTRNSFPCARNFHLCKKSKVLYYPRRIVCGFQKS